MIRGSKPDGQVPFSSDDVVHVAPRRPVSILESEPLLDQRLSAELLGVLAFISAYPDGTSAAAIAARFGWTDQQVDAALGELWRANHLEEQP